MVKAVEKKDLENMSKEMKQSIEDASQQPGAGTNGLDISQESITAAKYALAGLADNTSSLRGTTNLSPKQIKALSRMVLLNTFFKTDKVDVYEKIILEMSRSVTKDPVSYLNIVGNLFKNEGTEKQGLMNRIFTTSRR